MKKNNMNMKKVRLALLSLLLMLAGHASAAQFTVEDFEIAANETKTIYINLDNTETIYGFLLWIDLPEGITVTAEGDQLNVFNTSRWRNCFIEANYSEKDEVYKITGASTRSVTGQSGAFLEVEITASDMVATGPHTVKISHQSITVDNAEGNAEVVPQEDSEFICTTRIDTKIAASGYGSFSWPRALDFSACEGVDKVYVGGGDANGKLSLVEVASKQVPAGTGVVLKGTTGTVNPSTMETEPAGDQGTLTPTYAEAYEVTADNTIYVLKTGSKGTGFYPCASGVVVPKYKVYLEREASQGANMLSMVEDGTTGIDAVEAADAAEAPLYTMSGARVTRPTQKGIYVSEGKKVVIK